MLVLSGAISMVLISAFLSVLQEDNVIKIISEEKENVIFLLWGSFAKKKSKLINANKHILFEAGHPSPLSANRGYWFGNKCFSKTNFQLEQVGFESIEW